MSWPSATDYNDAIQDLRSCVSDEELRAGQVAVNALGFPLPLAGNFADVYKVDCPTTGNTWAIKCFTREVAGLRERYREISSHLERVKLPFMVEFRYVEPGIRIRGSWYPFLKMRWVEGEGLNQFVKQHLDRPRMLKQLLELWVKLAVRLRDAEIAHADLQHGNVLLVPVPETGQLSVKLIDYDGMYVPSLAGQGSREVGHPSYQHPQRLQLGTHSAEVDRFSHLAIYTALRCLLTGRQPLWQRYDNGENLLFRETDYAKPSESVVFQELWSSRDQEDRALVGQLILSTQMPLDLVPWLDEIVIDGHVRPLTDDEDRQVAALMDGTAKQARGASHAATISTEAVGVGEVWADPSPTSGVQTPWWTHGRGADNGIQAPAQPPLDSAGLVGRRETFPREPANISDLSSPATSPLRPTVVVRWIVWACLRPVWLVDRLLGMIVGEGNAILHNFLRIVTLACVAAGVPILAHTSTSYVRAWQEARARQEAAVATPGRVQVAQQRARDSMQSADALFETKTRPQSYVHGEQFLADGMAAMNENALDSAERLFGQAATSFAQAQAEAPAFTDLDKARAAWSTALAAVDKELLTKYASQRFAEAQRQAASAAKQAAAGKAEEGAASYRKAIDLLHAAATNVAEPLVRQLEASIKANTTATAIDLLSKLEKLIPQDARLADFRKWVQSRPVPAEKLRSFKGHSDRVNSVAFSPNGKQVLTGSYDKTAIVWDASTGQQLRTFQGHKSYVTSVAFSPNGKQVLTGSYDKTAIVWDASTGQKLREFEGHSHAVQSVAFSPNGQQILTGSYDKTAILWDASTGQQLRTFRGNKGTVNSMAFSPNGQQVLTGSMDDTAILWDASTGQQLRSFQRHKSFVDSAAFSPNGQQALTGSWDTTAILWNASTGQQLRAFQGHKGNVTSVTFSPNGQQVLTGSNDQTAILWDANTGKQLSTFQGHSNAVYSVAFSPNGQQVLTGSWDMIAILWQIPAASASPPVTPPTRPQPSRDPFEDLARRNFVLELPPTSSGQIGSDLDWQKLAEVYVDDPKDFDLEIAGVKEVFGSQIKVTLEPPATAPSGTSRMWQVKRVTLDPFTGTPMKNPKMLATIHLEKSELNFRWESEMAKADDPTKNRPDLLRACLLKVRVGDRTEYCTLLKYPLGVAMPIQLVGSDAGAKKDPSRVPGNIPPANASAGPPPGVRVVKFSHDQPMTTVPLLEQSAAALPFKTLPANLQITLLPPPSADPKLKLSLKSSPTNSQIAVDVDGQGHGFYFELEVLPPGAGGSENPAPTLRVSVNFDQVSGVAGKDELKWEVKDFLKKNYDLTWDRIQKRIEKKGPEIAEIEKKYNFEFDQLEGRAKVAADSKNPEEAQRLRQEANKVREAEKNDKKLNLYKEQLKEAENMQKYLMHLQQAMQLFQQSVVIGFRLSLVHKEREIVLFDADPSRVELQPPSEMLRKSTSSD